MSQNALKKVWSFFALMALTLSFLFFLRTTGVQPDGDAFGFMSYKAATIPVLALPMDMVLFGILLWLTWVWSESVEEGSWAERIPIFHFERKDVDPSTRGGKIYQRWSFALALVVPLLLTVQMASCFFGGAVYEHGHTLKIASGSELFEFSKLGAVSGTLRFGDPEGPQFFAWEPWLLALCLLAIIVGWLWTLRSMFR
ncbi:MAG: hypothetical protein CRU78_17425 [Candidatus Accumulibacter phosphatis]|uniref:Uncharacterized protein n=1 Tax=Candidatus Accumulibacter phosphatis TaxID=327160 RepID=A0A6A7RXI8_9PROT|nr:hypothetical protein [Candidatus Accumulibacter phosphatis]